VTSFEDSVIAVISSLQPGDVTTYGEVAEEAGYPGAARAVGNILGKSEGLPWWRVVGSGGYLRTPKWEHQAALLRAEGVNIVGNRVTGGTVRPT
jgi:methylated-DNA-protein-cysteine methyltransferase-like protein